MTQDLREPAAVTGEAPEPAHRVPAARHAPGSRARRKRLTWNLVLQSVAMMAIGLLVYPEAASWLARIGHNAEISGYADRVAETPRAERERILNAAYAYNDELEPGPLTDPYISMAEDAVLRSGLYDAYEEMLRLSGTDAIGTLSYPAVDIGLPMFHGTSDAVISLGIGHMYGTSLPVGGPSTRAVLTSHSGLPQAELFTPLHQAKVGDEFWISVLGEDHYYEVRQIEVVEPGQTESFRIIEGEDWVTLFTCTPTGVNSHRLLVHAARTEGPSDGARAAISGNGQALGFPWWGVWFAGGSAAVAWFLFAPPKRRRAKQRSVRAA